MDITTNDVIAEIQKAMAARPDGGGEDGITTKELAAALGFTQEWTRGVIARLIEDGVLAPVQVRRRSLLRGNMTRVPGFKLVK